jgi:hypothetical protein
MRVSIVLFALFVFVLFGGVCVWRYGLTGPYGARTGFVRFSYGPLRCRAVSYGSVRCLTAAGLFAGPCVARCSYGAESVRDVLRGKTHYLRRHKPSGLQARAAVCSGFSLTVREGRALHTSLRLVRHARGMICSFFSDVAKTWWDAGGKY